MTNAYMDRLTPTERSEADQLEAAILRDLAAFDRASMILDSLEGETWEAFLRCGRNLLTFRERRLYRPETWERYCLRQFTYTKSTIDRRLKRFEVLASLVTLTPKGLQGTPVLNERQARALYPVPEEDRPAVLDDAQQAAKGEGRRLTSGDIAESARKAGLDPAKYTVQPNKRGSTADSRPARSPVEGAVVCIRKAAGKIRWAMSRLDAGPQEKIEEGLALISEGLDEQA